MNVRQQLHKTTLGTCCPPSNKQLRWVYANTQSTRELQHQQPPTWLNMALNASLLASSAMRCA
jgi:hypothetical protein